MAQIRERVLTSGGTSYEVRIHLGGMPAKSKSFRDKEKAEKWASQFEGSAQQPVEESPKTLFSEVARQWLVRQSSASAKGADAPANWEKDIKWLMAHSMAPRQELYRIRQLVHDWGKFSIEKITRDRLERWMAALANLDVQPQEGKTKSHYLYNGDNPRK